MTFEISNKDTHFNLTLKKGMSLITNIIHDQFTLVVANKCENEQHGFEKLFINNSKNIMLMIAGFPMPSVYVEAFKQCENSKEAIALLEHYTSEQYNISSSYSSKKNASCQQCCITYLDQETQQFCSYIVSCTEDQRNVDIKSSISKNIMYRCIGSENSELTSLFQLNGVRKKMQQFSAMGKGADDVFEIIEITQKMYDIIHLIDDDIAFNYRAKYWVMDKDSLQFQQVQYHPSYFIPSKELKPQVKIEENDDIQIEEQRSSDRIFEFSFGEKVA